MRADASARHARTHRHHRDEPREPREPLPEPEGVFTDLIKPLQRAVAVAGYRTPTPIQEQCIPPVLEGRDVMGTAQTGTGKTAAFVLPMLQHLSRLGGRPRQGHPRSLILAPTRELAAQIGDSIRTYARFAKLSRTVVFGGVNQFHQVKALERGVDILVATPGRLLDLMGQGYIHLKEVEILVLDEVDRMLDMGFLPDVKRIMDEVPEERQTLFFSATMNHRMEQIAGNMVRDPVRVSIAPEQPAVERIDQKVFFVGKRDKNDLLVSLMQEHEIEKAIVFTQMKHVANRVADKLHAAGIRSTAIHGNKSQAARTKALSDFKRGRCRVLVATDVAARGLDVDDISHVFNYDLPMEAETYVHRIGRTARAGAEGDAFSFCTAEDRAYLRQIERLLGEQVAAELNHAFHCEEARHSNLPPPKMGGGRGQARGQHGGQREGQRGGQQRGGGHGGHGGGSQERFSFHGSRRRRQGAR